VTHSDRLKGILGNDVSGKGVVVAKRKQYVSEEQTNKALVALTEMAKKPKCLTLQQAIEKMRPKILLALQQGYTQQDVAELLKTIDIQISLVTLRQYLRAGDDAVTAKTDPVVETTEQTLKTVPMAPTVSTVTATTSAVDRSLADRPSTRNGKNEAETQTVAQTKPETLVEANPQRPKAMLPLATPSLGRMQTPT